ncbi:MAG TPA: hypothetical protein ENL06_01870 [Candidatus Portnoybacteria bacterium]|nr:hypothetical protein [Candidatus Portnoybacteria bacterium]
MKWVSIINGLAGMWLVVSAFLKFADAQVNFWNYLIVGIIIAVLSFWSVFSVSDNRESSK